jgi:hypothetical protein
MLALDSDTDNGSQQLAPVVGCSTAIPINYVELPRASRPRLAATPTFPTISIISR